MEKRSKDVLVAVTKPVRGREMIATSVPIDMFDSMRIVSAKRANRDEDLTSELSEPRKDKVETYYEGYVDGKKYLVPDSNLEAMKDVINLGMRQRRSTRFRHQTSADLEDEMTLERIEKMLAKIRDLTLSMSVDESGSTSKFVENTQFREERLSKQSSKMSSLTKNENGSKSKSLRSKVESEGSFPLTEKSEWRAYDSVEQQPEVEKEEEESEDCYLRLVLSGHFKKNENPIYIIQEYNTKSNLFCKQSADFTSSQTQGNVHMFIAGKIFNENILEETKGKPTYLNLKPNKIMIDENKCKVFRSYFENTYCKKTMDITVKGEFLQNEKSMDITPFLSITVKHDKMNMAMSDVNNVKEREEKRPSILVKNRQSVKSNSTEISNDNKRVSFKESFDDKELNVIYRNRKKTKADDSSLPTKGNYAKNENNLRNSLNKNQSSSENKQVIVKRKVVERIFYLITENSFFKKLFTRRK